MISPQAAQGSSYVVCVVASVFRLATWPNTIMHAGNRILSEADEQGATPEIPQLATREDWLHGAATILRSLFEENEIMLPRVLRISCGWPLSSQRGSRGRSHVIGQCWPRRASKDGAAEIFISPELDKGVTVAAVLVHELIHSADDCKNGHRGPFRKMAIAVGLCGAMRATVPGPELAERLNALCNNLGPYPHARLDAAQVSRKQRTRLIKVVCDRPSHRYAMWTTRMWLDQGTPTCVCGASMSEITRKA
jgi:hypothetical protein